MRESERERERKQTDRDRQADLQTVRQTDGKTCRPSNRHRTDTQTNRHTETRQRKLIVIGQAQGQ